MNGVNRGVTGRTVGNPSMSPEFLVAMGASNVLRSGLHGRVQVKIRFDG